MFVLIQKESLGAMKKTKLTRSLMAACSIVALSAVMYGCVHNGGDDAPATDDNDMGMEMPDPAAPVDVTMDVALGTEAQARLFAVLSVSGTSDTLRIEPGETGNRGSGLGVEFTCDSAFPCTVTVTNSLGTILASMTTQMLPATADPMVTAGLPDPVDAFARLNGGSTEAIRDLVSTVTPRADDEEGSPGNPAATELIGMGIGGPGVLDASMAGLRSIFDPNGGDFVQADGVMRAGAGAAAADPGAPPALMGGSTITGADDGFDASMSDIAPAPDGWVMKTLFRDWGDTAGSGDGGYETGAIVVKNLGEGTPYPFDRKLSGKYANDAAKAMFALTILADSTPPGVTTLGTSVDINSVVANERPAATPTQWAAMVFDSTSLVGAQDQDLTVDLNETFTGSYFGAPGQFQCIAAGEANCGLVRNDDGTVGVADNGTGAATMMGIQGSGRWSFTPDPGAMITVPDQDWMAYGAWLTTPDDAPGEHRIGVFFNGMDPWAPATMTTLTPDEDVVGDALRGTATYSGGATGVYVDGADSGLFTARAMLTADFDKATNGVNDAVDYMISGRIDNFRGTDGVFLGDDTQASPNDPTAGENDWVVLLGAFDFGMTDDGEIEDTGTTGSADGVAWTGSWNGQLFGPSTDADGPIAPSGVAGQFRAATADAETAVDGDGMPDTAVVGAFGATKDD